MASILDLKVTQQGDDLPSGNNVSFEKAYADAIENKILPGYALIAGDRDGNILYSKAAGVTSLKEESANPFQLDTMCWIASMTKLLTAVACLQAVEAGLVTLDAPVEKFLPEIGKYGIITGFDDAKNEGIFEKHKTPITLRMLLSHTSGHEYDWLHPHLLKWRQSRNEAIWSGPTVEAKSALPLVFEPGTSFRYSGGNDWAGKLLETLSGETLEHLMTERIFEPLGVRDFSFFPGEKPGMGEKLATLSTLGDAGEGPLVDAEGFNPLFGATDCMGGGGGYASAETYFTFLQAVMRRDKRLLKAESYEELFRPQLDERCKAALNEYVNSSPVHTQTLALGLPREVEKTWSFAGMVCEPGVEGRMSEGTYFWGGVPSITWYMDVKAGICGVAFVQVLPPMCPSVIRLQEGFQRAMFKEHAKVGS